MKIALVIDILAVKSKLLNRMSFLLCRINIGELLTVFSYLWIEFEPVCTDSGPGWFKTSSDRTQFIFCTGVSPLHIV